MMHQRMTRTVLTVLLLLAACKGSPEKPRHGPPLTPAMANQLKAIAPECEIKTAQGEHGKKELRLCRGQSAMMTIHLDDQRNLIEVEIGVWAPLLDEAKLLVGQTVKGLASDNATAALVERLKNAKSDPVWIDGVRVNAFFTQQPNENPRYTAVLAWQ